MDAFWIILTGALVALCCGLLGSFLLLRQMAMVGDAISHAVLPGIVIAFLLSGSRDSIPMLAGAAVLGVFATVLIEWLHRVGRMQSDASIGLSYTTLFAIGIILISLFTRQVDLDQDCVLYGEIAYVPLDLWILAGGQSLGPRAVWILGGAFVLILTFVLVGYKGLQLTTFDPAYAATLGISTFFWHYALMGTVSMATVVSFESVGAILVVAFLIVPPATAYLLTDRLPVMLGLSALFGLLSSILGYVMAAATNGSVAGAMSVAAGIWFILALAFVQVKKSILRSQSVSR